MLGDQQEKSAPVLLPAASIHPGLDLFDFTSTVPCSRTLSRLQGNIAPNRISDECVGENGPLGPLMQARLADRKQNPTPIWSVKEVVVRSARAFCLVAIALFWSVGNIPAQTNEVRKVCKEMEGRNFYLKISVVRIQHLIGGIDATNVYPGGKVYYRAKFGGLRQMQSTSAEDFAEEARVVAQKEADSGLRSHVRHWERGSQVKIHNVSAKKREVRVDVTEDGGSKSRIRFKFDKDMELYDAKTVRELFAFTFTDNEADLAGAEETVKIELGMSVEDVVKLKGKPKSEVDLGTKTIFVYDDLKLIFMDGQLKDVQ